MSKKQILELIELAKIYLEDGAEQSAHHKLGEAIKTLEKQYAIAQEKTYQSASVGVPVMDYDPNMTTSGRKAKQVVRMTFAMWEYRATFEKTVGGNSTGLNVIDCAICQVSEETYDEDANYGSITMLNDSGKELICVDDEDRGEEWLKDMLISAEIVSITPNGRI